MSSIKFAIVGCGRIAQRHAEHISNTDQCELVACCDIVKDKAQSLADKYKAKSFYDINELLKDTAIDVVSVCSPNGLHSEHSILALNSGKNVLCEKPMAINAHDCGRMINAAEKANKRLFIIKQNRYNPPVKAVKNLIEEGQLGNIFNIQLSCFWNRNENYYENSWKGTNALDGGTLYTQFSHFIDLLYYLNGDIKDVAGFSNNFTHKDIIEFEDTGVIALKFQNGAIGTINYTVNAYSKNMEGSLTLFGDKGTVKIGGQYLNELEYFDVADMKNAPKLEVGNKANNYGEYKGSMSNHDKIYNNVRNVLLKNDQINTNMFEGLKTVEIIDKIYEVIRS
jgi:predicted dehydrogenase